MNKVLDVELTLLYHGVTQEVCPCRAGSLSHASGYLYSHGSF